jgi:hypothetical protein
MYIEYLYFCFRSTISYSCPNTKEKEEGKISLGRPRRECEDNIKMDLREIGWIYQYENVDQWRALVNTAMNLRVP